MYLCDSAAETRFSVTAESKAMLYSIFRYRGIQCRN